MKRYVLLFLFNILVVTGFTSGAQACISKLPIRTFEGIGTEKLSWTYSQFAAHFGEDLGPLLNVVSKAADGSTVRVREAILFPDSEEKRVVLRWGASEYIASMIVSEGSSRRVFEKAIDTGIRVGVDVKQLVGNSHVTAQTISSTGLVTARYIDDFCVVGGWVLTFQVNPRQASGVLKALSKSGEVPPQARIKKPYGKITRIELKIRGSKNEPW